MSYIEYYNWETQQNHMFSFTEVPRGKNKNKIKDISYFERISRACW